MGHYIWNSGGVKYPERMGRRAKMRYNPWLHGGDGAFLAWRTAPPGPWKNALGERLLSGVAISTAMRHFRSTFPGRR